MYPTSHLPHPKEGFAAARVGSYVQRATSANHRSALTDWGRRVAHLSSGTLLDKEQDTWQSMLCNVRSISQSKVRQRIGLPNGLGL
jgi:hypothetical protein